MRQYPELSEDLRNQLEGIVPNCEGYYPCKAILRDGTELDCVFLAEAESWFKSWGVWPEDDAGKEQLDVHEIVKVLESPNRLPAQFAKKVEESGMGYSIFTLHFRDGSHAAFGTGNAVDFITYPTEKTAADVTGVAPHEGRHDPALKWGPDYYWALFTVPKGVIEPSHVVT